MNAIASLITDVSIVYSTFYRETSKLIKASDAELLCFFLSAPEQTVE